MHGSPPPPPGAGALLGPQPDRHLYRHSGNLQSAGRTSAGEEGGKERGGRSFPAAADCLPPAAGGTACPGVARNLLSQGSPTYFPRLKPSPAGEWRCP